MGSNGKKNCQLPAASGSILQRRPDLGRLHGTNILDIWPLRSVSLPSFPSSHQRAQRSGDESKNSNNDDEYGRENLGPKA